MTGSVAGAHVADCMCLCVVSSLAGCHCPGGVCQVHVVLLQGPPAAGRSASAEAAFAALNVACCVQAMLERAGVRVMLNELSSTVVFERPTEEAFVRKWQLACQVSGPVMLRHPGCC